ncbi:signal transduction histidine kinase [Lewinella aquimaris]|uniref:histidine kinase n=1 Tax=Neolewinella aquimaris TaxID=1835722 RepID=A0A840E7Q5_9BACT|nr:ATP-binding protein [Neolewinella aquimaris]MBB4081060.1 signal transduction histidine kinase [Neolewinella aquimaris]
MIPPKPPNEPARLANLREYAILDSLPEEEFDDLTTIAAQICGTPVSLISLIDEDRQWFKSAQGMPPGWPQTSRDLAFCAYNIMEPKNTLMVRDARLDPRFENNDLVYNDLNVIFYAGVPLVSKEGFALGSLCVIDHVPRELSQSQLDALERLGRQVIKLFELRRTLSEAEQVARERAQAYAILRDFSHVIAHDLKAPLRNIRQAGEMLEEDYLPLLPEDGVQLLHMIQERARDASQMIDGVLRYSQITRSLKDAHEDVSIPQCIAQAERQVSNGGNCRVTYIGKVDRLYTSSIALLQTFQNLIGNALKFNDKEDCQVIIDCIHERGRGYVFTVEDNGPGIEPENQQAIFRLFHSIGLGKTQSHGVGLTIVQRLIEAVGGSIRVESTMGTGTKFIFVIPD